MVFKRICVIFLGIFLIIILFSPAKATMKKLGEFKGVIIPFNLKHEDSIVEKGKYDFQFFKLDGDFLLRIIKKGKPACLIPGGKRLDYETQGLIALLEADPEIPEKPKLNIKRNPALKIAYIIFESGKKNVIYPFLKIRFEMEYEE